MTEKVTLIIKSTVQQNFTLEVSPSDTLALVQQRLASEYFGNPRESDQTVSNGELVRSTRTPMGAPTHHPSPTSTNIVTTTHEPHCSQLIYAGKVLKDKTVKIQDLVGQVRHTYLDFVFAMHPSLHPCHR